MKRWYKCKICGEKSPCFTQEHSMERHIISHEPNLTSDQALEKFSEYFEETEYIPPKPKKKKAGSRTVSIPKNRIGYGGCSYTPWRNSFNTSTMFGTDAIWSCSDK